MKKETVIAVSIVATVVVLMAGWLLLSTEFGKDVVSGTDAAVGGMEGSMEGNMGVLNGLTPADGVTEEIESDELDELLDADDVTRIIVLEPDEEIMDLLSEKVIKNGQIVDQQ